MKNSADQTVFLLGIFNIIFLMSGIAIYSIYRSTKSKNYFLKESALYLLAHSLYMTISVVGAKYDTLFSIGFSAFFSFFPMYYHIRLVKSYNHISEQKHDHKSLSACAAGAFISILLYVTHFDYLSYLPIHNSMFTSFTLPFAISLVYLCYNSISRCIKSSSLQNKIGAAIVSLTTLSTFYLCFYRMNPEHTIFGYTSILVTLLISYITLNALIFKNLIFYFEDAISISKRTWALGETAKLIVTRNNNPELNTKIKRFSRFFSDIEKKADDYLLGR